MLNMIFWNHFVMYYIWLKNSKTRWASSSKHFLSRKINWMILVPQNIIWDHKFNLISTKKKKKKKKWILILNPKVYSDIRNKTYLEVTTSKTVKMLFGSLPQERLACLKVLATIPYFNFHFFSHLLIFVQFRDPFYVLNLSTKAVLQKWHN